MRFERMEALFMSTTLESQYRTLALKFYIEQTMPAEIRQNYTALLAQSVDKNVTIYVQQNALIRARQIEQIYREKFFKMIEDFHYKDYKICAIYHDKDTVETKGSPFEIAIKKGHWHVLVWRESWKKPIKRFRVRTIINKLHLNYAPALDTQLWKQHGAETIKSSVANYVSYLPHRTEEAISDGKYQYDVKEIAKNFSDAELNKIFAYYEKTRKKTELDWDILDQQAIERGLQVKDFDAWINSKLSVTQRAKSAYRIIHHDYEQALLKGVHDMGEITRCSILIHGKGNVGKTYTTFKTLEAMHMNNYDAVSKSGKYDGLSALHTSMTFNDVGVSDAKNVFDNWAVVLHRRNSGDRPWVGKYVVVTTNNTPFEEIVHMAGIKRYVEKVSDLTKSEYESYKAIEKRLYICHINPITKTLVEEKKQRRGDKKAREAHDKMFYAFQAEFDYQLQSYNYIPDADDEREFGKETLTDNENNDPTILSRQELKNIVQLNQKKQVNSGSINPF